MVTSIESLEDFWKNKRVLITGHTGFKGSWLTLILKKLNAEVIGFALPTKETPNNFSILNIEPEITNIYGDIRDYSSLFKVIKTYHPEIILHLAAQSLVRQSYSEPVETYETNVMGTVNLLEAARQVGGTRAIVNVTTDKCYENKEWYWGYRENDRLGGYDPYSNSKACSELVTAAYRESFFNLGHYEQHLTLLASARAGNVIGGGDWSKDRLIPDIVSSIIKDETVFIRNPHAIRPWQHVFESLSGYLSLAQKLYAGETNFAGAWNFGPNDQDIKSVNCIVNFIMNAWANSSGWKIDDSQQPHEAELLRLDCTKSKMLLNWHPHWNLETALLETIAWYKAFYHEQDMRAFSEEQLNRYFANFKIRTETDSLALL